MRKANHAELAELTGKKRGFVSISVPPHDQFSTVVNTCVLKTWATLGAAREARYFALIIMSSSSTILSPHPSRW